VLRAAGLESLACGEEAAIAVPDASRHALSPEASLSEGSSASENREQLFEAPADALQPAHSPRTSLDQLSPLQSGDGGVTQPRSFGGACLQLHPSISPLTNPWQPLGSALSLGGGQLESAPLWCAHDEEEDASSLDEDVLSADGSWES